MIYIQLFLSFLQIGAFSFGGGYAAMSLIQEQVVTLHSWLGMTEFTDLVTIAEMTPGPIAVNAATFVGTKMGGVPGALAATAGCILPSCIFVTLLAYVYTKYRKIELLQGVLKSLRPAVVAMIANAGLMILLAAFFVSGGANAGAKVWYKSVDVRAVVYFIGAMLLLRKKKWNPIAVMALCGAVEVAATAFFAA